MSHWEAQDGSSTQYVTLHAACVSIGSRSGTETDNAFVSWADILSGSWDAHVKRYFGEEVLDALRKRAAMSAPDPDPPSTKAEPKSSEPKPEPKPEPKASEPKASEPKASEWEEFD